MRVLVTGSEGFVGKILRTKLESDGHEVYRFDLRQDRDIRDYEQVRTAIESVQPDRIYHLAAQAYVPENTTNVRRGFEVNMLGTLNLLEAMRHTGCQARVLLAGTSEEYGYDSRDDDVITEESNCCPTTPYGVSKLAASRLGLVYARQFGLTVTVTRAWNHTGPGQPSVMAVSAFARRVAEVEVGRRRVVDHGTLDVGRSYLDVRDVVEAYVRAIELGTGLYNVCSDRVVSMRWILKTLVGMANCHVHTQEDPRLVRPGQGLIEDFPTPSATKLAKLTGWQPKIPLERTLEDTLNWWREEVGRR